MTTSTEMDNPCYKTLDALLNKYENNEYMLQRINTHITTILPNTLENEFKNHEKRVNRTVSLRNNQNVFIQVFLSKNRFFYIPANNFFYEYTENKYMIVKEDYIIHTLLSSISKDRTLLQWKHKTRINVLKQIKDRPLYNSIPETETIQNVLNILYPAFFSSKKIAKYFLTIIGDNILKKNQHLIFLVSQNMKQFLIELDNVAVSSIGNTNTTSNFMTKYHENHLYENCRLIKLNGSYSKDYWREKLNIFGLDLLCVATHYSKRYTNSDLFIVNNSDEELKKYAFYVKSNTQQTIIDEFCDKCIISTNSEYKMEWKNVHFIWKQFLSKYNIPNVIYSTVFKNLFMDKYSYVSNTDQFCGLTSTFLPMYGEFILFWNNVITINDATTETFDSEFEIDEIHTLFKMWVKDNSETVSSIGAISEDTILNIIKHFFPTVEIIDDKFILNISCSLWNKIEDINKSFKYIKESVTKDLCDELLSFDDIYRSYCDLCNKNNIKNVVSKQYYDKYLYHNCSEYIEYDTFIKMDFIINY